MRVVVVSPETSYHRAIDVTHRLERLVVGLAAGGHDVTVLTTRWWADGDGPSVTGGIDTSYADAMGSAGSPDAPGAAAGSDDRKSAVADGNDPESAVADGEDPESVAADGPTAPRDDSHPASRAWAEPPEEGEVDDDGVRTVDGVSYRALADGPGAYRSFLTSVPGRIARARPDVIHAVASRPGTVVAARAGGSLARSPVIAEWYDATDADADDWFVRQAARRPDRVVVPSRLVRRQLRELGADGDDVRVVPNAVRLDDIEGTEPSGGGEIVFARRLDEAANLESLLLGLAELRDYDWSAIVVGEGPARPEYEQQVRDLRIDDRVTFAGECDREERIAIYRDSHVFVQTARRSPFATELLWGLACGCVGIVEYHAESSAHELVEGRDRGFRTTTPDEMADAIRSAGDLERLTVDDSFGRYDESAVVDRYLDCYESVTERYGLL